MYWNICVYHNIWEKVASFDYIYCYYCSCYTSRYALRYSFIICFFSSVFVRRKSAVFTDQHNLVHCAWTYCSFRFGQIVGLQLWQCRCFCDHVSASRKHARILFTNTRSRMLTTSAQWTGFDSSIHIYQSHMLGLKRLNGAQPCFIELQKTRFALPKAGGNTWQQ